MIFNGCHCHLYKIGNVADSKRPLLIIPKVQLFLRVTRRSWQKLFAGKNFVKILVTAQTQLRSYSEQHRAFGNSNICNCIVKSLASVMSYLSHITHIPYSRMKLCLSNPTILLMTKKHRHFCKKYGLIIINDNN